MTPEMSDQTIVHLSDARTATFIRLHSVNRGIGWPPISHERNRLEFGTPIRIVLILAECVTGNTHQILHTLASVKLVSKRVNPEMEWRCISLAPRPFVYSNPFVSILRTMKARRESGPVTLFDLVDDTPENTVEMDTHTGSILRLTTSVEVVELYFLMRRPRVTPGDSRLTLTCVTSSDDFGGRIRRGRNLRRQRVRTR
jgi:hypothetical protein